MNWRSIFHTFHIEIYINIFIMKFIATTFCINLKFWWYMIFSVNFQSTLIDFWNLEIFLSLPCWRHLILGGWKKIKSRPRKNSTSDGMGAVHLCRNISSTTYISCKLVWKILIFKPLYFKIRVDSANLTLKS